MKIIYSWGHTNKELMPLLEAQVREWIDAGYDITPVKDREELGIIRPWSPQELDRLYHNRDEKLLKLYDKVERLAETHDIFICNYGNVYHPEFIKSLKKYNIYTVICSGDDPENSDYCSKPYVHAFDHAFAWGVNFDEHSRIAEKFLQWGARRAGWWPYGVRVDEYDPSLTEEKIYSQKRDIDLVYVGAPGIKLERLAKIKKAFPQMRIYGMGWGWKAIVGTVLLHSERKAQTLVNVLLGGLWHVRELPMDEVVPLYQNCKIGINMHMSFGPSNRRTYQLPANGVMQVCDCPEGLEQVFDIGKEVLVYHSTEEAIELIKYYLEHDDERKEIAAAGFRRTMKDYKRITTFSKAIEEIKKGMLEDGMTHFKDGTVIELGNSSHESASKPVVS